jgi:hypothetical protein
LGLSENFKEHKKADDKTLLRPLDITRRFTSD